MFHQCSRILIYIFSIIEPALSIISLKLAIDHISLKLARDELSDFSDSRVLSVPIPSLANHSAK
jgi:hypothetical protein